ncbi:MAG: hypothetical protein ABI670_03375 [Chloroflexota bacterium]
MEIICLHCGATNRGTSRFCARCGRELPTSDTQAQQNEGSLELPWLQAVQDKAVQRTSSLDTEGAEATRATPDAQPPQAQADAHAQAETPPASADAAEGQPPVTPAGEPEDTGKADEPPPPWVVSILEPTATPGSEQSYEAEELSHIMPWAYEKQPEAGEEEAAANSVAGGPGLPPWLGDVTVQETLQALPPSEQKITEPVEIEFEGLEPFTPPVDETDQPEQQEELPDWLRTMGGEQMQEREQELQRSALSTSLAKEPTEFLKPTARDMPVRPPRAGAVETLAALLQPVAPEVSRRIIPGDAFMPSVRAEAASARTGWRGKLLPDGLIYLLVLAALLTVLIVRPPFGEVPAPASPGVLEFYNAVEAVPAGKPVLVVYDWDASRSAEMSILSRAVMHHIMQRKLPFVTVSTVPQGPGFAQQVTTMLSEDTQANYGYTYGTDYLVLGYLPGNEAALRSLTSNFATALPLDYVNGRRTDSYPLVQGGAASKIEDFGLIIELASSEADLRNWIEQVASRTNLRIVAAVPQGLEPFARPYLGVPGAGLDAVLSGTAGATQYARQLQIGGRGVGAIDRTIDLNTRLNAQSVAALLVALVIAAAMVTLGTKRIMRRG